MKTDDSGLRGLDFAIQPLVELLIEPLDHRGGVMREIGKLAPLGEIIGFSSALDLPNKVFHQHSLFTIPAPQMLLAEISGLLLSIFCAKSHISKTYLIPCDESRTPGVGASITYPNRLPSCIKYRISLFLLS